MPAWEAEHTKMWYPLTLTLTWGSPNNVPQRLNLTIVKESAVSSPLMCLDGGFDKRIKFGGKAQDAAVRSATGEAYVAKRGEKEYMWSLDTFARLGGSRRSARWVRKEGAAEGTLPAKISVTFTGGIARAWRGDAPTYAAESPAVANKKRINDLLGFVTAARIPEGADMGSYGSVKQATLIVDPSLVQRASQAELALFLAMLCDFYWTQGEDNWFEPPILKSGNGEM